MVIQTIVADLMDRPGALSRVLNVIKRRGLNVESLNVVRTNVTGVSRLTMNVETEHAEGLRVQLSRIIDVLDVQVVHPDEARKMQSSALRSPAQADGHVD